MNIYVLIDPRTEEIRYVGQTRFALDKRLNEHLAAARYGGKAQRFNWMRKLMRMGLRPRIELIQELVHDEAWEACERYWIAYYRNLGCRLVNNTDGGGGTTGCVRKPWSEEAKARQSLEAKEWLKNHPEQRAITSETTRRAMVKYLEEHGDVYRAKISAGLRRRYEDPLERQKTGEASRRQWATPGARQKHSERMKIATEAERRVPCPTCGWVMRAANLVKHRRARQH